MELLSSPQFWLGLGQIIWINIILSGDNAVVIALAARGLGPRQQKQAIFWGTAAAVLLRVVLTVVAVKLMQMPWLQLVGGLLLLWIGVQLLNGGDDEPVEGKSSGGLLAAIRTILVADLVMSLDNVIGVAAAANGNIPLLVIGLAIAIPIVIFGSTLMIRIMGRFPAIVTLGAALIGWVGGETLVSDKMIEPWIPHHSIGFYAAAALGAVLVVAAGKFLQRRNKAD
ncbi:MAG: YjbE family putative metal transport protein [Hydrogenophaga sp.]|uniref:TerC family protein n=1 Tax=Hydrogenophaga sp. TaxID=1904254 RepID=UPI0016958C7C|nr:TerC family protein [Hydrogenophaga sp.]NIM39784.1 YjbE family putative metal transport protein [Hydrogenophaga sp.]NIN24988.1 YjbE family putative metal transport protein [Hydrogenophaga sp.]NIN29500.1 YjbE family putative metal transport protein [Hydrogenophaga sp.]NIN54023.1 YjbE family putative metal transport protein [Hydrogenophaga sp.]NIO50227.1 YjbE family putative metal transport protein [Hydrogenophaga sp.]